MWVEPGMNPARAFVGTADIQQQRRAGIERGNFVPLRERHITGEHVLRGHAGEVDGVFGRAEWRRVGQFQFGQVMHRHPGLERGGQHVNAFVHAFMADGLRAEQFAGVGREQDFQRDGFGAGVVARVRAGMKMNRLKRNARRAGGIFSFAPVQPAVRLNNRRMAVPQVCSYRDGRPKILLAAMRPWRFAGPASGISAH